jgi:hypothetical protein
VAACSSNDGGEGAAAVRGDGAASDMDGSGGNARANDFEFDREAVLGEWPTTSRVRQSDCPTSLGDPTSGGSGTTEIRALNDQVVQIRRVNDWRVIGALDSARAELESAWMEPDGTPVRQALVIEFLSLTEFVASATLTVEPSGLVPSGCSAVLEDHGIR